jgi:subtilisin family serine protease
MHPDLAPHFQNTVASANHGTHVAGIIGSVTNSAFGVASVSFNNVKLYGYTFTNWIGALNDAVSQ